MRHCPESVTLQQSYLLFKAGSMLFGYVSFPRGVGKRVTSCMC